MNEAIMSEWRKARKRHGCDYCNGWIQPGERYHHYVGKYDGEIYTWDSHEKCEYVAQEIWEYCDPDEGLDADNFLEGCSDVCRTFVCPDCGKWDNEYEECDGEGGYCLDKLYDLFQTKELYRDHRDGYGYSYWKLRDRKKRESTT